MFAHGIATHLGTVHVRSSGLAARDAAALFQTVEQRHNRGIRENTLLRHRFSNLMNGAFAQTPECPKTHQLERRREVMRCGFSFQDLVPVTLPSAPFSLSANADTGSGAGGGLGFAAGVSTTGSRVPCRYLLFFSALRSSAEL